VILFLLNANRRVSWDSDFVFAITFFLSTSSMEIIFVFCFSRNSSIFLRKVGGVVCFADSGASLVEIVCGFLKIGAILLIIDRWSLVVCFGSSGFFSDEKAYFHIILSCCLNGIAKSLMFRRATRIDGSSFSSVRILFCFSFVSASFSIDFRFSVWSSSFCSWPGRK